MIKRLLKKLHLQVQSFSGELMSSLSGQNTTFKKTVRKRYRKGPPRSLDRGNREPLRENKKREEKYSSVKSNLVFQFCSNQLLHSGDTIIRIDGAAAAAEGLELQS